MLLWRVSGPGTPLPFGASRTASGINFSIVSRCADQVTIALFQEDLITVLAAFTLDPSLHRTGDVWHIQLSPDGPLTGAIPYGFFLDGPSCPEKGGHAFQPELAVVDPYARAVAGCDSWGERVLDKGGGRALVRSLFLDRKFDWQGDRPLNRPLQDTIIYELNVRGFTSHPSSGVAHPGTFQGVVEKIPYLRELGITAVELMPVTEFDENEIPLVNPVTGERLRNLWGYSPISFFAPKASLAATTERGGQVREFKEMVRQLHRSGIEVVLDVVFNHTGEGGWDGPGYNFRLMDNPLFYLLHPVTREYLNFSGCGNTLNCNHPMVREMIMECLRYWVVEMHVDGFRFDLASVMGRAQDGQVLADPPMVEKIAEDPILAGTKIIAEAWDASGLYQVGSFSNHLRWAEWNGRFRDDVRRFVAGRGAVTDLATRIAGSSDLYLTSNRRPSNSINFITSHDGFTLADLVRYDKKHNGANGEDNRDGADANDSWNTGVEGETDDARIVALRLRRMKTMALLLFVSRGVPMFPAGDEFGRTQLGNNNAYCQDNPVGWVDWRMAEKNSEFLRFFTFLIRLRKKHPVFRQDSFFHPHGSAVIHWQGERPGEADWSADNRFLAFHLPGASHGDHDFFVAVNGHREKSCEYTLPVPPAGTHWRGIIDTSAAAPGDVLEALGPLLRDIPVAAEISPFAAHLFIAQ